MRVADNNILRKIDQYIEENREQMIRELSELVQVPSVQSETEKDAPFGKECKRILEETKKLYEKNGFATTVSSDSKYALSFLEGEGKTIGLFSHGDVVPADGEWEICKPFEPIVKDGYVFGRGCNDDKSGIVQSLYAAKMIRELKLPFKSRLLMMTGSNEETGMKDILSFAENEKMPDASLVLDGEYPYYGGEKSSIKFDIISKNRFHVIKNISGGKVYNIVLGEVKAELEYSKSLIDELNEICKGNAAFEVKKLCDLIIITAKGKSAHTANVDESRNALVLLSDMLAGCESIPQIERDILGEISRLIGNGHGIGFGIEHTDKDFGQLICSNGLIHTEDQKLVVGFDIRAGISFDTEDIKANILKATGKNWDARFKRISRGYLINNNLPCAKMISDVYAQLTGDTKKEPRLTSGGTYARALSNAYAIGTVDYNLAKPINLPDGHGGVHQPDEKISVEGFLGALKILVCLLLELDKI